jgi:CMP-N-acetylneuraminic acid synthetase
MEVVAIIPARGGSKGILKKNLQLVGGRPLIEHSISHALSCDLINTVVVSTDCPDIKYLAEKAGALCPFLRPAELAEDHVLDHPVFLHACISLGLNPEDIIVHLRPTSPYRRDIWTRKAIEMIINDPYASSVRSVHEIYTHPYRTFFKKSDQDYLQPFVSEIKKPYEVRRQDWPPAYFYNCVVDVARVKTIIESKSMTGNKIKPFIMNEQDVYDIDTLDDLEMLRSSWDHLIKDNI